MSLWKAAPEASNGSLAFESPQMVEAASKQLDELSTFETNGPVFCRELFKSPAIIQHAVMGELTKSYGEGSVVPYTGLYTVKFTNRSVNSEVFAPFADGFTFDGNKINSFSTGLSEVDMFLRQTAREKLMGSNDFPKLMDPYFFIAANAHHIYPLMGHRYEDQANVVLNFASSLNIKLLTYYNELDSASPRTVNEKIRMPSVREILESGFVIDNASQWVRKTGQTRQ
jgi:hypothetical protein